MVGHVDRRRRRTTWSHRSEPGPRCRSAGARRLGRADGLEHRRGDRVPSRLRRRSTACRLAVADHRRPAARRARRVAVARRRRQLARDRPPGAHPARRRARAHLRQADDQVAARPSCTDRRGDRRGPSPMEGRAGAGAVGFGAPYKTDGGLGIEAPWIVTEPDGSVVNPDTLLRRWKRLVKVAGVTPIGLHGAPHLRRTRAVLRCSARCRLPAARARLDRDDREHLHARLGRGGA